MLLRNKIIELRKNLLEKTPDRLLSNKKILDTYIKEKLYENKINICKCLDLKYIDKEILYKMYPYISEKYFNDNLRIILKNNTKSLNSKEITDFLLDKVSNKDDYSININDIFMSMYNHFYDNNNQEQLEENDIKRILEYSKEKYNTNTNSFFDVSSVFSVQKNIDFILKEKKLLKENKEYINKIIINKKVSSEFLDKFLDLYIKDFDELQLFNLTTNAPFTKEIIEKYKSYLTIDNLRLNSNLSENILTEYVVKNNNTFKLRNQKVSKKFLKDNIDTINYDLLFQNIDNEKDYESFIDLARKNKTNKEETVKSALNYLNNSKKLDYNFYDKIFKKYDIEKDLGERMFLFNENTSEKHLNYIEEFLEERGNFIEKGILTEYLTKAIKHIIKYVNLPEKILEKYIHSLKINEREEISYDLLIRHQKLPKKIINDKEFIKTEIVNTNMYDLFISSQVSNKNELLNVNNNITETQKIKNNFLKKEVLLLKNIDYLKTLKNNEILELMKKDEDEKIMSYNHLFLLMENNERKIKLIPKTDYGISLF